MENNNENVTNKEIKELIENIGVKVGGLENHFDGFETRFDGLENRFDSLETKVDSIVDVTAATSRDIAKFKGEVNQKLDTLEERTFSPQEKKELLDLKKHYDTVLEQDIRGKDHITLARSEYDATAQKIGFENRFRHQS